MTYETERRLLDLINAYAAATRGPDDPFGERAACLNEVAAELSAAIHAPTCRIGGEMPEPWPGMGVELVGGRRRMLVAHVKLDIADPTKWRLVLPDANGAMMYEPANIAAVFDGSACVWRRW